MLKACPTNGCLSTQMFTIKHSFFCSEQPWGLHNNTKTLFWSRSRQQHNKTFFLLLRTIMSLWYREQKVHISPTGDELIILIHEKIVLSSWKWQNRNRSGRMLQINRTNLTYLSPSRFIVAENILWNFPAGQ